MHHDGALDRRDDTHRAVGAGRRGRRLGSGGGLLGLDLGVMGEQGERIAAFDACAGEAGLVRRGRLGGRRDETLRPIGNGGGERRHVFVHPARVHRAGCEIGMRQDVAQERDVGGDAVEPELAEGAGGASHRVGEVGDGECTITLASSEVEGAAGAVAGVAEPVGAHARPAGRLIGGERAAARTDRAVRADGLHVHPRLDRVAARRGRCRARPAPVPPGVAPCASLIWVCTRSMPVTASVTVCSTCSLAFASMNTKGCAPGRPDTSTRNSNVPRLL